MKDYYYNYRMSRPVMGKGVKYLLIANVAVFFLQSLVDGPAGGPVADIFGLSLNGIMRLRIWQLISYMFLHGFNIFHILFNMLGLFFFGRDIEDLLGTRRFIVFYLGCGIVGGLGWLLIAKGSMVCIGASGAVYGLLGAFAAVYPDRRITLLLFFVLPVTLTARVLALGLGVISLYYLVFGGGGNVCHIAHLAGGLAGFFYAFILRRKKGIYFGTETWARGGFSGKDFFRRFKSLFTGRRLRILKDDDEVPDSDEVNEVLEKVSVHGIESLSNHEKEVLDRASRFGVRR